MWGYLFCLFYIFQLNIFLGIRIEFYLCLQNWCGTIIIFRDKEFKDTKRNKVRDTVLMQ
jgi:hypothetical protein